MPLCSRVSCINRVHQGTLAGCSSARAQVHSWVCSFVLRTAPYLHLLGHLAVLPMHQEQRLLVEQPVYTLRACTEIQHIRRAGALLCFQRVKIKAFSWNSESGHKGAAPARGIQQHISTFTTRQLLLLY